MLTAFSRFSSTSHYRWLLNIMRQLHSVHLTSNANTHTFSLMHTHANTHSHTQMPEQQWRQLSVSLRRLGTFCLFQLSEPKLNDRRWLAMAAKCAHMYTCTHTHTHTHTFLKLLVKYSVCCAHWRQLICLKTFTPHFANLEWHPSSSLMRVRAHTHTPNTHQTHKHTFL